MSDCFTSSKNKTESILIGVMQIKVQTFFNSQLLPRPEHEILTCVIGFVS